MKKTKFLALILFVFTATSCDLVYNGYSGACKDLYTVAINSLLHCRGYMNNPESWYDPEIELLESDSYGRTMFIYAEGSYLGRWNLLISQKTENPFVYFYPDYNFIASGNDVFSDEQKNRLKELNDWGKELNLDKCSKSYIVNKKAEIKYTDALRAAYMEVVEQPYSSYEGYIVEFISDKYGRTIFTASGMGGPDINISMYQPYIFILDKDGNHASDNFSKKLENYYDYQDDLYQLKILNNWNVQPN